jgi:hypothetical protein
LRCGLGLTAVRSSIVGICVVGVDVGSVAASNFAWAGFDAPSQEVAGRGDNPFSAALHLAAGLSQGLAALVVEAPMSVPVPPGADGENGWRALGRKRSGEGARPWSASAGASALATGLAQGAWMLRELASRSPGLAATTQPGMWRGVGAQLLLAEAFVSGSHKPRGHTADQHAADAEAAGLAFVKLLAGPEPITSRVVCSPRQPFNLLAAMAMWAGLRISPDELRAEVLVAVPGWPG